MTMHESLWGKIPDYRVDLESDTKRIRVRFDGEIVADSRRTLVVRETKHDPVIYFPREDVRFERLERTRHQTFCPFKGDASYWSLRVGDRIEDNAAWSYESPFDEVAGLKDYIAFYPDRVEWDDDG
ncbi:MAG: DUF427 domain-containing protein [Gemmatimonadota bacterium]